MLLIADSGSTKTEWRVVDEDGNQVISVVTEGLNPYFQPKEKITNQIEFISRWVRYIPPHSP